MVSLVLMVEKIFTKNCSAVHYFLTEFKIAMINRQVKVNDLYSDVEKTKIA